MRLIKGAFALEHGAEEAMAGERTTVLVAGVSVVCHEDGVRQPGVVHADIRGKTGSDGYLATKEYGARRCVCVCACV
jgi:hypothetical protein